MPFSVFALGPRDQDLSGRESHVEQKAQLPQSPPRVGLSGFSYYRLGRHFLICLWRFGRRKSEGCLTVAHLIKWCCLKQTVGLAKPSGDTHRCCQLSLEPKIFPAWSTIPWDFGQADQPPLKGQPQGAPCGDTDLGTPVGQLLPRFDQKRRTCWQKRGFLSFWFGKPRNQLFGVRVADRAAWLFSLFRRILPNLNRTFGVSDFAPPKDTFLGCTQVILLGISWISPGEAGLAQEDVTWASLFPVDFFPS